MKWSRDKPEQQGWYWVKANPPFVVWLRFDQSSTDMLVEMPGLIQAEEPLRLSGLLAVCGELAGPIPLPEVQ